MLINILYNLTARLSTSQLFFRKSRRVFWKRTWCVFLSFVVRSEAEHDRWQRWARSV
ncbi:hypothetical protein, partial [Sulfurospirillum arcachonense]|uniref:hypothetical protein n=1 Tax=Sulfurospirillum arcachonense TaxID=57666 RepID=UPI003CCBBAD4